MKSGPLLLIQLLLAPALALAQGQYYGTVATRVTLSEAADPSDAARLSVKIGDVITPENVRQSIQALFDTGRYRTVEVDAAAFGAGTQLTFDVTPHYFFSTFELRPGDLMERPLSTLLRLPVGEKFSTTVSDNIAEATKQILEDEGYFAVPITYETEADEVSRLVTVRLTAAAKSRARISAVTIQGGENAFSSTELRDALNVSSGDRFRAAELERGLEAVRSRFLESSYLNTRVEAQREYEPATNTVRVVVTITPGQRTVIDTGNVIPAAEVRELLPVFEEGYFDPDLMREGRVRIVEYLQQQGYFEARVEGPEVVTTNEDGDVRIAFKVEPGERHTVRSIQFQGNTVFTEDELRDRIQVRAGTLLNRGLFSTELADADVTAIQSMYRRIGYEAAFVEYRLSDEADHNIDVIFEIFENVRYPIERLILTGNLEVSEQDLRSVIPLKEGSAYSPAAAEDARTAMMALYYARGYPDVRIEAAADRNPATSGRLLTFQISEGRRYRIGEILVAGNTRTAAKVVRRSSGLKEYAFYNPEEILAAQQNLYATGLFSHVDIVHLDRDTGDVRTLLIQVEEAKPILVTPGLGIKEYAGPGATLDVRATLDISHNNLFGLGRSTAMRFRWGIHEQQFQTTYREPRLFNHDDLDGYGTLTLERTQQRFFDARRLELALQIRKRLSPSRSLLWAASYQTVNLDDIRLNPIVRRDPDAEGVIHIARLETRFVGDERDDALDPKSGFFTTSQFQIASRAWGSEVNFVSVFHQSNFYRPAPRGTLAFSSRVGWKVPYGDDTELPITERYFAGGSTTLRGFGLDEAGPPGGGQFMTVGNVEYRVPIKDLSLGRIGGALFYDTGNVFERPSDFSLSDFTHSAGFGLRFQTPLGPVRFDVGFNLNPKIRIGSDGQLLREKRDHYFFTLGHTF